MPKFRRVVLTIAAAVLAIGTVAAVPAAALPSPINYVSLGDSYTAGPLILPWAEEFTCARSAANYPSLVAAALPAASFHDVSCSSATTYNFTHSQAGAVSGTAAPQYDALTRTTSLVTVGIGGNDIGLVSLAESCINLLPPPFGTSCEAKATAGGVDTYAQKIKKFAPTYGRIVEQIRRRSPNATIVLVGYPYAIQHNGCYPSVPVYPVDANYLQGLIDQLNAVMARQARAHGALYVDTRTSSVGHDVCQPSGTRWVEGVVPQSLAYPLHPNALGMQNDAAQVEAVLAQAG